MTCPLRKKEQQIVSDAGESTEGMAESTSKLRKQVKALTNVDGKGGVDILADEKTFRSTYDIMSDIAGVWGEMSDIDQSALLELLAGKVRSNQVAALLSNFDQAQEAMKTSQNAEGTMDKVHRAWMDSVEARKAQFEAAQETLSMTAMPANTLKGLYQTGTSALGLLNTVIGGTGPLGFGAGVFGVANALRSGGGNIAAGLGNMFGWHRDTINGGFTHGDIGFVNAYNEAFSQLGDKQAAFAQATAGSNKALDSYTMSLYSSTSGLIDARKVTTGFGTAIKSFAKNALVGIGTFAAMEGAAFIANQAWQFIDSQILHRGETLANNAAMAHAEVEQAQQTAQERKEERKSIQQQISGIEQKGQANGGLTSEEEAELMNLRSQLRIAQYRQEIAEAQAQAKAAKSVEAKTQSYAWDRAQETDIGAALYTIKSGSDARNALLQAAETAAKKLSGMTEGTPEYIQTAKEMQELDKYGSMAYMPATEYANSPEGQALLKLHGASVPAGLAERYQALVDSRTSELEKQFSEADKDLAGIQARSENLAKLFDFINNEKNLSPEALGEAYQFAKQEYEHLMESITATNGRAGAKLGEDENSAYSQLMQKDTAARGTLADRLNDMETGAQGWLSDYFLAGGKISDTQKSAMQDYINSYLGLREVSQPGGKIDAVRSLLAGTPLVEALIELDKLASESKLTAESISGLKVDNVEDAGQKIADVLELFGISLTQAADMWNASSAASKKETDSGGGTTPAKVDVYGDRKTSVAKVFAAQEAGEKQWAASGYTGGMTFEEYDEMMKLDEGAYAAAIEYAHGGLFFNKDVFDQLVRDKYNEELNGLRQEVADTQKKYNEAAQKLVQQAQKKAAGAADFDEKAYKATLEEVNALGGELGGYRAMQVQIANSMGDYANWLRNKSGPESGDMYNELASAAGVLREGRTSGKVGTRQFEAAMRFYTGQDYFDVNQLSTKDWENIYGMSGATASGKADASAKDRTMYRMRKELQKIGILGKNYEVLDPTMTADEMAAKYNAAYHANMQGEGIVALFDALNETIQNPANKYVSSAPETPEGKAAAEAADNFMKVAKAYQDGKATAEDLVAAAAALETATNNSMLASKDAESAAKAAANLAADAEKQVQQENDKKQTEALQQIADGVGKMADVIAPQTEGQSEGGGEGEGKGEARAEAEAALADAQTENQEANNAYQDRLKALEKERAAEEAADQQALNEAIAQAQSEQLASKRLAQFDSIFSTENQAIAAAASEADRNAIEKAQLRAETAYGKGQFEDFDKAMEVLNQVLADAAERTEARNQKQLQQEQQDKPNAPGADSKPEAQDTTVSTPITEETMPQLSPDEQEAAKQALAAQEEAARQEKEQKAAEEARAKAEAALRDAEHNKLLSDLEKARAAEEAADQRALNEAIAQSQNEQSASDRLPQFDSIFSEANQAIATAASDADRAAIEKAQLRAEQAYGKGQWAEFDDAMEALGQVLSDAAERIEASNKEKTENERKNKTDALEKARAAEEAADQQALNEAIAQAQNEQSASKRLAQFDSIFSTENQAIAAAASEADRAAIEKEQLRAQSAYGQGQWKEFDEAMAALGQALIDAAERTEASNKQKADAERGKKTDKLEEERAAEEAAEQLELNEAMAAQAAERERAARAAATEQAEAALANALHNYSDSAEVAAAYDELSNALKDEAKTSEDINNLTNALNEANDAQQQAAANAAKRGAIEEYLQKDAEEEAAKMTAAEREELAQQMNLTQEDIAQHQAKTTAQAMTEATEAARAELARMTRLGGDHMAEGAVEAYTALDNALNNEKATVEQIHDLTAALSDLNNETENNQRIAEIRQAEAEEVAEQTKTMATVDAQRRQERVDAANALITANADMLDNALTQQGTALYDAYAALQQAIAGGTFQQINEAMAGLQQAMADYQSEMDRQAAEQEQQSQASATATEDKAKEVVADTAVAVQMTADNMSELSATEQELANQALQAHAAGNQPEEEPPAEPQTQAPAAAQETQVADTVVAVQMTADDLSQLSAAEQTLANQALQAQAAANQPEEEPPAAPQVQAPPPVQETQPAQETGLTEDEIDAIYDRADAVAQDVKEYTSQNLDGNEALMAAGMELANYVAGLGSEISPQELAELTDKTQAMLNEAMGLVMTSEGAQDKGEAPTRSGGEAGGEPAAGSGDWLYSLLSGGRQKNITGSANYTTTGEQYSEYPLWMSPEAVQALQQFESLKDVDVGDTVKARLAAEMLQENLGVAAEVVQSLSSGQLEFLWDTMGDAAADAAAAEQAQVQAQTEGNAWEIGGMNIETETQGMTIDAISNYLNDLFESGAQTVEDLINADRPENGGLGIVTGATYAAAEEQPETPDVVTSASVEPEVPSRQQEVNVETKSATISVPSGALGVSTDMMLQGQSALFGLEDSSYASGLRPNGEALTPAEVQAVNNAISSLEQALTGGDAQALTGAIDTARRIMQGNISTGAQGTETTQQIPGATAGAGAAAQTMPVTVETPEVPTPSVEPIEIPVTVGEADIPTPSVPSVTIPVTYGDPGALSVPTPGTVTIPVAWGDPGAMPTGISMQGIAAASGEEKAVSGTYLVDERGAELIEHVSRGTYELGTNSGARFTKLNAGDIVHTASETKRILGRGGAKSSGGVKTGGAMGNGNITYSGGTGTDKLYNQLISQENVVGKWLDELDNLHQNPTVNTKGVKEFLEWLKKQIDWIPTYLGVLKKKTTAFIEATDDAIHYLSKNQLLDNAISNVSEEIKANMQAALRYQAFLQTMRAKVIDDDMARKVENGVIDITQYKDEDTVKAIQAYQEYWNKLVACRDALKSLNAQMETLSAQKLDSVVSYFSQIEDLLRDQQKTFESLLDMKRQYGQELTVSDYADSMRTVEQILANARNEEAALMQELQEQLGVDGDLVNAILKGGQKVWDVIAEHVKKNTYGIVKDSLPDAMAANDEVMKTVETAAYNTVTKKIFTSGGLVLGRNADGSYTQLNVDIKSVLMPDDEDPTTPSQIKWDKLTAENLRKTGLYTEAEIEEILRAREITGEDSETEAADGLLNIDWTNPDIPVTPITDEEIIALGEELGLAMSDGSEEALANFETIKSLLTTSWEHPLAIGSDTWYEYMSTLENLRESIYSAQTEIGEMQDKIADIPLNNLKTGYDYLDEIRKNLEDINSLLDAQGSDKFTDTFRSLIAVGMKQIENLQEQNKLIEEQMDSLDPLSEKYQELRAELNGNLDTIADIRQNQEEWNDEIIDLQIDRLKKQNDKYKEQLSLMRALDNLENARQRRILVYHEAGGFQYEADEEELEAAQESATDAVYSSIISELERQKGTNNIYGPLGERLIQGSSIVDSLGNILVPVEDRLSGLDFGSYYQSILAGAEQSGLLTSMLNSIDMAKLLESAIGSNDISIDLSGMTLNEVNDVKELCDAIMQQLPNYLLQAMYQRGA